MAKLQPKDPQFGIPIAARIKKEIATQFNETAKLEGKSFSRYLSEFIEKAIRNETQLQEEKARNKKRISDFIATISKDRKEQNQLIEIYKTILRKEKTT